MFSLPCHYTSIKLIKKKSSRISTEQGGNLGLKGYDPISPTSADQRSWEVGTRQVHTTTLRTLKGKSWPTAQTRKQTQRCYLTQGYRASNKWYHQIKTDKPDTKAFLLLFIYH